MKKLTIDDLVLEAGCFSEAESGHDEPALYGVTDGKAIGTYLEHKFNKYLSSKYEFAVGNAARGIDFPELSVDVKFTNINKPQSSSPFRSARQKIYGLGYSLLVFVYDKADNVQSKTARLNILHAFFVEASRTADFQTTTGICGILDNNGNKDDVVAFLYDRLLPVDDIQAGILADEIMQTRPEIGYLTISNALQWRLQYSRVIEKAGVVSDIIRIK